MVAWEEAKTVLITNDLDRTLRQGVLVTRRVRAEEQQARRRRRVVWVAQAAAGFLAWLMAVTAMSIWAWLLM
ncbi:MAG: hypothetical protein ACI8S6_004877 [Myxococcota bacterium]|jgi:hypothetical protein